MKVKTASAGASFGELALLYTDLKRNATVKIEQTT
jgi:hypothetical protein